MADAGPTQHSPQLGVDVNRHAGTRYASKAAMDTQSLAWMEFAFNIFYLVAVFGISGAMFLSLPHVSHTSRPVVLRLTLAFTLLGIGDLGHIGLRILAQLKVGRAEQWVGWGGLTTAITVTVFYLLMLDVWRLRFAKPFGALQGLLVAVAVVRLALLIPAENQWGASLPPFGWSLARNIPLVILGVAVTVLYLRDGRKPGQRSFFVLGVLMAISYACYAPVILLVQRYPLVGLLMIPKTVAYLAMGGVAYVAFFQAGRFERQRLEVARIRRPPLPFQGPR